MIREDLTDEELVALIEAGSESAEAALYERYYLKSRELAKYYSTIYGKSTGITYDEFFSVAFATVASVVKKIDSIYVSFEEYWKMAVRNNVFRFIQKNSYTSGRVSLSGPEYSDSILDRHLDDTKIYIDDYFVSDSQIESFLSEAEINENISLTDEEKKLADLIFFSGYTNEQAYESLGWKYGYGRGVLERLKRKLYKMLKEHYE